jgi:hypothetical protein
MTERKYALTTSKGDITYNLTGLQLTRLRKKKKLFNGWVRPAEQMHNPPDKDTHITLIKGVAKELKTHFRNIGINISLGKARWVKIR